MAMELMVALFDANGVRSGRVEANLEVLDEAGFMVVERIKVLVSEEQASALTSDFPEPRDFISGPVVALLLKRENAYEKFAKIRHDLDDTYASCDAWSTLRDRSIFFPTQQRLERTLVVVKPKYTQEEYAQILQTIDNNDFVVIDKLSRVMTPEMAKGIFIDSDDAEVDYVSSDVSVALVIEKIGAVDQWNLLLGPADPELAKIIAPRSLRATLGKDKVHNSVYGSSSPEKAVVDISLRFPGPFAMERTLALIKPHVIENGYLNQVMELIADNGFTILASETLSMSAERAEQLFADEKAKPSFPALVRHMSSGPTHAMVLGKPGAISAWQKLVGPADVEQAKASRPLSLRARFGTDEVMDGFHCSETAEAAKKEIDLYFSQLSVEKIPSLLEVEEVLNEKAEPRPNAQPSKSLQDVLVDGLTELCRVKPVGMDAITWLGEWLLRNNPNKPVVAAPVVEEEELSVRDAVASGEGSKIIWAVGSQGSGRDEQCAYIVKEFGYEFIDVESLVASTEASGNEYGELIKECKRQGKGVPTHIITNLIKDALLNSKGNSKFIINSFPSSLDEAFDFEKRVGDVDMLLYFDCADQTRSARLAEANIEASEVGMKAFKAGVFPVIDHYSAFSKIAKISTDGSSTQVTGRVQRLFR